MYNMSIKTLGESINIGVNNTITKNINLSTGSKYYVLFWNNFGH